MVKTKEKNDRILLRTKSNANTLWNTGKGETIAKNDKILTVVRGWEGEGG